jgi:signal transduction histidine kinase/CheY-like chemotaxis protein/PAS domain-containing protein/HPt (histidine-containing phosphotransfer) domain-containing protein
MKPPSDPPGNQDNQDALYSKIIGLGERSMRKSYYPELQERLAELTQANLALQAEMAERQQAETALRESEARFRSLFEDSPIGLLEEDLSEVKQFIDALQAAGVTDFAAYFDAHPEEVVRAAGLVKILNVNQVVLTLYKAPTKAHIQAAFSDSQPKEMASSERHRLFRKELIARAQGVTHCISEGTQYTVNGDAFYAVLHISVAPGYEATWAKVFVSVEDLTEWKKIEEALRQSERRLLEAQAIAHVGNWELTLADQTLWASAEIFRIYGEAGATGPYMSLAQARSYQHPDDLARTEQGLRNLIQTSLDYAIDYRIYRKNDGALRVMHSWSHLVRDEAGRPLKILGVLQDVTEAKEAEQELEQHRFHLEELVKERTRELEQSRATALKLMQEAEQARAQAEALLAELKESETALIAAKEAAEAASRAKSAFVANMSHEIRTPMNAIVGLTHLVLAGPLSTQQRDYLAKVQDSAQHLLSIINDILDFSKMEADKVEIEALPFDLNQIFESLATMTGSWTRDKHLEIIFDLASDVPTYLVGDPLRVEQVLINLGNNAAKFTAAGEVVIGTRLAAWTADYVTLEFSVRDTGIGMTPEQIGRLFTAFSQGDAATTRQYGGTGLGLAITKRLVELMGGTIRVESQPRQGSCFTFTLPFKRAAAPATPPAEGFGLLKALIVEDNLTAQVCLQNYLKTFVGEVGAVATGEAALDCLAAEPYDIVFLDWQLPGIDGVETARRLKAQPAQYGNPHIIFVTAYGREQIMWQARELGVDGVLIKPTSPSAIFNALLKAFQPKSMVPSAQPPGTPPPFRPGARVLVVEDNAINQDVARGLLEQIGIHAIVADSGEAALALLALHAFDAVLMDVQMPEMDGYETTRRIRQNPTWRDLPIIAMTAHAMVTDRERSFAAGMNDHVTKPVAPAELHNTLARWLPLHAAPPAQAFQPATVSVLNPVAGLLHTGNEADYVRLLGRFLDEYGDLTDIRAALDRADIAQAELLAHSLKGVAATLGAEVLQQTAKELEAALRQNPPAPWEALLSLLGQDLEVARAAMLTFREQASPAPK